jgi:nucleoside phosphorylase
VTAPGDVVVAESTYQWDEGRQMPDGLVGDHRQIPLEAAWLRAVQDFDPTALPSHGAASDEEAMLWLLERLHVGGDPREHPARRRYFGPGRWRALLDRFETDGWILRDRQGRPTLTVPGRDLIRRRLYDDVDEPQRLPFTVIAAPMASGSAVMADRTGWHRLARMGVQRIAALDMEAATIATVAHERQVPHWLVAKGVAEPADPARSDRYRRFAARASAEVMFALLQRHLPARDATRPKGRGHRPGSHSAATSRLRTRPVAIGAISVATVVAGATLLATMDDPADREPESGSPSLSSCARKDSGPHYVRAGDAPGVYTEFCLALAPGFGYDVDLPPGEAVTVGSGWQGEDSTYALRDLYLSSAAPSLYAIEHSGKDVHFVRAMPENTGPADCQRLTGGDGSSGPVLLRDLEVGAKLCMFSYEARWAMLQIASMPAGSDQALRIYVTVLDP